MHFRGGQEGFGEGIRDQAQLQSPGNEALLLAEARLRPDAKTSPGNGLVGGFLIVVSPKVVERPYNLVGICWDCVILRRGPSYRKCMVSYGVLCLTMTSFRRIVHLCPGSRHRVVEAK